MQTNLMLNDKLVIRAQKITGVKTKREAALKALRLLILLNEQSAVRNLRGKLPWDGDLNDQRLSRVKAR